MSQHFTKRPRLRLDRAAYLSLRKLILERDAWRCQACGRLGAVQVHHIQARSRLGSDAEDNLITLCPECHRRTHRKKQSHGGVAWHSLRFDLFIPSLPLIV